MISLGCAKNLVDAEIMLGSLLKSGIEITNDAAQADAVIVNPAPSLIPRRRKKAWTRFSNPLNCANATRRGQAVIVSGCLPQRFRDELPKLMPEVDAFMGIDQVAQVGDIVSRAVANRAEKAGRPSKVQSPKSKVISHLNELEKQRNVSEHEKEESLRGSEKFGKTKTVVAPKSAVRSPQSAILDVTARPIFIPDFETPRFRLTPKHFAYLKIAEGCNLRPRIYIIPRMRGSHRSRTQKDIVAEAKALIADGMKEINLISQDSTYYGLDLRPEHSRAFPGRGKIPPPPSRWPPMPRPFARCCANSIRSRVISGSACFTRIRRIGRMNSSDDYGCKKVARYVDMPLPSTSTITCSNGCAAKRRSNTSWI